MLMMHAPQSAGDWEPTYWPPSHHAFMQRLYHELSESGELVIAEGLASPCEAKLVRASEGGIPTVAAGPLATNQEFLRGFWIVEVDRPERAYEIAGLASAAPGPGDAAMMLAIEVRRVLTPPAGA